MSRAAFLVILAASFFALPLVAATRQLLRQEARVEGEPQPGATAWLLIGADAARHDAAGVQLYASRVVDIVAELNPTTGAVGEIAEAHGDNCGCEHFHGSFYGGTHTDPDPEHCGWGCVVRFDTQEAAVKSCSTAIMREYRAAKKAFDTTPPDYTGAMADLDLARTELRNMKQQIRTLKTAGKIDTESYKDLKERIDDIYKADGSAVQAIRRLKSGNPTAKQKRKVESDLGEAQRDKDRLFVRLCKDLGLQ